MKVIQKKITLTAKRRGFHLIDEELLSKLPEISQFKMGTMHLFLQHTSASLSLGENADSSVRRDLESYFNDIVAEDTPYFTHTYEGKDDMPAHIKSTMIGVSLTIPITDGRPALGTWQGVYLNEHRDYGGSRKLVVTIMGV